MLQAAQPQQQAKPAGKTTLSGKKQAQSIAQSIAKQIANEPVEILNSAADQILGVPEKKETSGTQGVPLQGYGQEPDAAKIQRREARHLQAFREELQQIQQLKRERVQQFQQSKQQVEQQQQQLEDQKSEGAPVEAPGKAKKGGMMQGAKKKISNMLESFKFKKQRGIETQKMPSN
ncbi:MAG: hypothetical protein Q7S79_03590 [bacterium]|nr:hypothetical protein [bacterium]